MKRTKNYYCWYTIGDWLEAQKQGYAKMRILQPDQDKENLENSLKKLLTMAENDCFPLAVICMKDKKGYYLDHDYLLYRFFDFLNNKISLSENGKRIFFANIDSKKKSDILNAQIPSVWIDNT